MAQVTSRTEALKNIEQARAKGQRIGFTSGVFDLLHIGHVNYLSAARKLCDFLVVAINSDSSVKKIKGEKRPIVGQLQRAEVVAALACVDLVFIFDEPNNNKNIELLKPDLYIKAGDYDLSRLSSAPIVESYGGKVAFVQFEAGNSTSAIIETIKDRYLDPKDSEPQSVSIQLPDSAPRAAAFLDRDGTIIEHVEYLHQPEKVVLRPGAAEGLIRLKQAGYLLVVVTNQPGIGLGYFTVEDFFKVNRAMLLQLKAYGVLLDKIYFCPHQVAEGCRCRKPNTLLVERAVQELNIKLDSSIVIGDTAFDIGLGKQVGCRTALVETVGGVPYGSNDFEPDIRGESIDRVVDLLLR